jgi:hypothetical protein
MLWRCEMAQLRHLTREKASALRLPVTSSTLVGVGTWLASMWRAMAGGETRGWLVVVEAM